MPALIPLLLKYSKSPKEIFKINTFSKFLFFFLNPSSYLRNREKDHQADREALLVYFPGALNGWSWAKARSIIQVSNKT